ncbi:hypothetical protein Barb7_01574 [Bacteroidales bacterium Barb7]|nr:hypothetical protein Barb7_01574 [Bacteroidales bacterium Barb7]
MIRGATGGVNAFEGEDLFADAHAHAGVGSVGDHRFDVFGMEEDFLVKGGIGVGVEFAPFGEFPFADFAAGGKFATVEVVESDLVRGNHAAACTHFDGEVADGEAVFHRGVADGFTGVFDEVARCAAGGHSADDVEGDVFGGYARTEAAVNSDAHGFRLALHNALGGEGHFHFAGADAEGDGSHGTVGGGVGIAADDGHARLSQSCFWADDVDDAVAGVQ